MDIRQISTEKLQADLDESLTDIDNCREALRNGITQYSGGSVLERLRDNKYFVEVITKELKRREK